MYQIFIVACKDKACKGIGTNTTSLVTDCGGEQPCLYFCTLKDAVSYRNKLPPEIKRSFKIFDCTLSFRHYVGEPLPIDGWEGIVWDDEMEKNKIESDAAKDKDEETEIDVDRESEIE